MTEDRTQQQPTLIQQQRVSRITLATFVLMFVVAIVTLFFVPAEDKTPIDNYMMPLIALSAGIAYFLARKGNHTRGVHILLGTIFIVSIAYPLVVKNIGWQTAIGMLLVTTGIANSTLSGRSAGRISIAAFLVAILIILIETFAPGDVQGTLTTSAIVVTTVLGLVYLGLIFYQFPRFHLRTKLLVFALGTGLLSILAVSVFLTISTQQALTTETRNSIVSSARHIVAEIDTYIGYTTDTILAEAQLPQVVEFLKATPVQQEMSRDEILALFNTLLQRDPEHIGSYALLNSEGLDIVDTYTSDIGIDKSNRDYFLQPRRTGRPFVSPVRYSPTSPDHSFYIGVPVRDENGRFIGVLRVRIRASLLDEIVRGNNGFAGPGSYGILMNEYNLIIAHGTNPEWISRTPTRPDPATFSRFQIESRISDISLEEIALGMPDFAEKLDGISPSGPYFTSTDEIWGGPVEVGVARSSKTVSLKVVYIQPQDIALAAVDQQTQTTVVVALITGFLILLASFYVSRIITQPIVNLASALEQIASGNLSARAEYDVQDEVGALAVSFNRMTSQLRDTLAGLERRVAERTADLETARLLSERRAQDLQSISEISRAISIEQRLEILLPLITRLVSERFDFYHVGIFFVDEAGNYAYLQAANSEGGQRMLARGHRLEIGTGLVGTVADTAKPRIALDVGADAVFFNNPDLPATRSEMALPLNIRGRTIGVLDVQSTSPGAFTENDANTLAILADQVAIAIENARLFGQIQQAREEAEALYAQIQRREWGAFIRQEARVGYRQTATGGRRLAKLVETDEIRQALMDGQVIIRDGKGSKSQPTLAVPVMLRGQTIGVLNIKAPTSDRKWNQDEINLAQAISDRLALALDNARLLQESQRRAAKEARIGKMSARIGASINMRNVLQAAVEELGRALPGSEVVIQFQNDQDDTPKHEEVL
jgi:GAF domain-containing protein/HAMP domain-containing protein